MHSPLNMAFLLLGHSMIEAMGVIISFLLFKFTSMNNPPGNYTSQPYVAAASLIPFCAGMFIHSDHSLTCLGENTEREEGKRQIPVSIVFHVIVSLCYWFMKLGKRQCDGQVDAVEKLKKEMFQSKQNKKMK